MTDNPCVRGLALLAIVAFSAVPDAIAQDRGRQEGATLGLGSPLSASPSASAGARSTTQIETGTGTVGQRQTRDEVAPNIEPLGRITSRVSNRVQNRLRNRIDRQYDSQANANSPFAIAEEQAQVTGRRRRR